MRELIDADRLPGQPYCTPEKLAGAQGRTVPAAGLAAPAWSRMSVLADPGDRPRGIIAYLSWSDVHTGLICWVHGHEDLPALRALLGHALAELNACPQTEAYVGAPPGPLGPGGLPRTHRAATHEALLQTGFTGRHQGRYLHCALPAEPSRTKLVADVFPCEVPPGHRLVIHESDEPVAEAVVSVGPDRTATVYWIETRPTHRGRGLGRKVLSQALALLAELGAAEVALVVEDAREADPDRAAATRLFESFGFTLVDHLWTYQRRRPRVPRSPA
ncbi:GNAT family N-acetyltransferase [Streptomyces sp. HUAS ZL42]|uniref:GNAT family N-acetyltransferase n=1 Tax=Streptomyces sp. HUAS ZL42 TaxID=3231715 RepID=UPI00345E9DA0